MLAIRLLNLAGCEPESVSVRWSKRFLKRNRKRLAANLSAWAAAGDAWSRIDEPQKAVDWLSDWQAREGVSASMLLPLVANLWVLKRPADAELVSRHVARLAADESMCQHALWIALGSALHGQFDAARTWLARADATQLEGFYQSLHAMLSALVVASQADDYATARRLLHDAHKPVGDADWLLEYLYHRCQLRLARQHRRWFATCWHACRALMH